MFRWSSYVASKLTFLCLSLIMSSSWTSSIVKLFDIWQIIGKSLKYFFSEYIQRITSPPVRACCLQCHSQRIGMAWTTLGWHILTPISSQVLGTTCRWQQWYVDNVDDVQMMRTMCIWCWDNICHPWCVPQSKNNRDDVQMMGMMCGWHGGWHLQCLPQCHPMPPHDILWELLSSACHPQQDFSPKNFSI